MHQHLKAIHGVVLTVVVFLLSGSQDIAAQVDKATLWQDAAATELDVDFGGTGFHARWKFKRCDCGDLSVQVEQIAPDEVLTGELLMVDGKVLLSQGFTQQGDDIEPLIQAPSLMLQLAYAMLSHSQPGGPFAVDGKQQWNKTEKNIEEVLSSKKEAERPKMALFLKNMIKIKSKVLLKTKREN